MDVPTLGKNIQRLRVTAGHTNATAFARSIGTTAATLKDWETGRYKNLRLDNLLRLAKGIPCAVEDLVRGIDMAYDRTVNDLFGAHRKKLAIVTPSVIEPGTEWPDAAAGSSRSTGGAHGLSVPPDLSDAHRRLQRNMEAAGQLDDARRLIVDYAQRIIDLASRDPRRPDRETPAPVEDSANSHPGHAPVHDQGTGTHKRIPNGKRS